MHGVLLTLPTRRGAWCGRLANRHPEVSILVENLVPTDSGGAIETVAFRGADLDTAIDTLLDGDHSSDIELIERRAGLARFHIRTQDCAVACATRWSGLVPDFPFEVTQEGDIWLVLGQKDELKTAMERYKEETGEAPRVMWSGEVPLTRDLLTTHQRNVLLAAVESGFYAFPRKITLTDLARKLGVSKATLSETLMVIESKIMQREASGKAEWPPRLRALRALTSP